jgi:hypothetical protein
MACLNKRDSRDAFAGTLADRLSASPPLADDVIHPADQLAGAVGRCALASGPIRLTLSFVVPDPTGNVAPITILLRSAGG